MKRIKQALAEIRYRAPYFLKETAAALAVALTFIAFDRLFLAHRTPAAWVIWEKGYSLGLAVLVNTLVWYVPFTVLFLGGIFLAFRWIGKDRAEYMGMRTAPNLAASLRDYLCVLAVSFIPVTLAAVELTGTYRVPPGLLAGTVFCWIIPVTLVNMSGATEGPRETLRELAVIALLVAAGKLLPAAITGYLSYRGIVEYLLSIAVLYNLALGASIMVYNRITIAVKVKKPFMAYPFWVLSYGAGLALLMLPVLLMIVVALFASLFYLLYLAVTGHSIGSSSAATDRIFFSLVLYGREGINPAVALAPFRFLSLYFRDMALSAASGSPKAIAEILTMLLSTHLVLDKYRRKAAPLKEGDSQVTGP